MAKRLEIAALICIMLVFCAASADGAQPLVVLNLKPEVVVRASELTLAQVLTVTTAEDALAKTIKSIPIGKAPYPGRIRLIGAETIRIRLQYEGIDTRLVSFNGDHVKVRTDATKLSSKEMVSHALSHVRELLPFSKDDVDITVIRAPNDAVIPRGEKEPVIRVSQYGNARPWGRVQFVVRVIVDDEQAFHAPVWLNIRVFSKVAVALSDIRRGEAFTRSNVGLKRMETTQVTGTLSSVEAFIGQSSGRPIRALTPLSATMLARAEPVMKRGDVVTMLIEKQGLRIAAHAQVSQGGRVGETVRVVNLRSKREVYGKIVDARTVRVIF